MRPLRLAIVALSLLALSACASSRANITALSQEQNDYFDKLETELKAQRDDFRIGLELQLTADARRRQNLLSWQRQQQKADILLHAPDFWRSGRAVRGQPDRLLGDALQAESHAFGAHLCTRPPSCGSGAGRLLDRCRPVAGTLAG